MIISLHAVSMFSRECKARKPAKSVSAVVLFNLPSVFCTMAYSWPWITEKKNLQFYCFFICIQCEYDFSDQVRMLKVVSCHTSLVSKPVTSVRPGKTRVLGARTGWNQFKVAPNFFLLRIEACHISQIMQSSKNKQRTYLYEGSRWWASVGIYKWIQLPHIFWISTNGAFYSF